MTGEGIAQALHTGILAAEAIATGRPVAATYERAVEHHLARDLRFARTLGRILTSPAGARGAVRIAGLTPWTRRSFARWMFEDYPRRWSSPRTLAPGRHARRRGVPGVVTRPLYLASPLGFHEPGRHYLATVLLPRLADTGWQVLDPWVDEGGVVGAALATPVRGRSGWPPWRR